MKNLVSTVILPFWGIAFAVVVFAQLPERVPVHFGFDGQPDRWGKPGEALFGLLILPTLALLSNLVIGLIVRKRCQERAEIKRALETTGLTVSILLVGCQLAMARSFQGGTFDPRFLLISIGLLLIVIGNFMPTITRNPWIGLRLQATLASDRAWRKANRAVGWLFVSLGIALIFWSAITPVKLGLVSLLIVPLALLCGVLWLKQVADREYQADPDRESISR
jgi:uncharacterized membrane protein